MKTIHQMREPDPKLRAWAVNERPTGKLLNMGCEALSDAELLSVILRTGSKSGLSSLELARDVIAAHGSLTGAVRAESDLLDAEQIARIGASMELARRVLRETMGRDSALSSPQACRDYLRLKIGSLEHEVFVAVFLDAQNRVLAVEELFRGTLTQTSVFPREIVKRALHFNAAAIIFAHNHPSGIAEPSRADEALTQNLKHTLALVDVKVLDHFVIGGDSAMSFAERGLL